MDLRIKAYADKVREWRYVWIHPGSSREIPPGGRVLCIDFADEKAFEKRNIKASLSGLIR